MHKILFISMSIPYSSVPHAGGKTFNFYVNAFASNNENEITLIAKVLPEEKERIKQINPKIRQLLVATPENKYKRFFSYIKSLNSKLNPFYKYCNVLSKEIYDQIEDRLDQLKKEGYYPDVVILEWTWILLFIDKVKERFPNSKYIASEHDVSFLRAEREYGLYSGVKKIYKKICYRNLKRREIECIKKCDYVVTHNEKDKNILIKNGIRESLLGSIIPYYEKFQKIEWTPQIGNILFYGAMNRHDNETAVLWFIDNVMPLLKGYDVKFIIVGNKPSKKIKDRECNNIIVTGYVDDPSRYFKYAMCMVAPLLIGAGVKVKIIECMSSGIPVITNEIGIEGIEAENGKHYFFAKTPKQYAELIIKMIDGEININNISNNARYLIDTNFDLNKSFNNYRDKISDLISIKNEEL